MPQHCPWLNVRQVPVFILQDYFLSQIKELPVYLFHVILELEKNIPINLFSQKKLKLKNISAEFWHHLLDDRIT